MPEAFERCARRAARELTEVVQFALCPGEHRVFFDEAYRIMLAALAEADVQSRIRNRRWLPSNN